MFSRLLTYALGVGLLFCVSGASAQTISARVVSSCGGNTYVAGQTAPLTVDTYGNFCTDTSSTNSNLYSAVTGPIPAGGNVIGSVDQDTSPWVIDTGGSGNLYNAITGPTPAGTNTIGSVNTIYPVNITPTDCSTTISSGGAAQTLIAATATIHGFQVQNIDTGHSDEPAWISLTTTAAANTSASYVLPAPTATTYVGVQTYTTPPGFGINHAVSVIAATTGHIISCTYW